MNVTVYAGSQARQLKQSWIDGAVAVGQWLGRTGSSLIYGGVDSGLTGVVAKEAKQAGGDVVGVVPMRRREWASKINDVEVPTSGLDDRKNVMQLLADVFVVLPGGYGTLDEFTAAFSYLNFTGRSDVSIILYNPDGIYTPLLDQLHTMVDATLLAPDALNVLTVVTTPEEIVSALDHAQASLIGHPHRPLSAQQA